MAFSPWRIMPDMLLVTALKFSNPIRSFIYVKTNDLSRLP
jgi:hypothetical protein